MADDLRHSRQIRFAPIGAAGQERLRAARVAVVGCGALGSACAEQLGRAGVGRLRLIDRDLVEVSNLQRQTLYTLADAEACLPKAVAAAARLAAIDPALECEPVVGELNAGNALALLDGCDLVIDGGDNFPTRHLVNEACCAAGRPWIYGACVGAYGVSAVIVPGETACLRCLQSELPAAGEMPTCDTAGIIAPAVHLVAAWQVAEALKLLCGDRAALRRELWACDLWRNEFRHLSLTGARDPACPACGPAASRPLLAAGVEPAVVLCGRDAVQVRCGAIALDALARHLGAHLLLANAHLVRWRADGLTATAFADGRVLVQGAGDPVAARAFCDRWLG
jgi:adenylyltransferase/sulfurtransferase